MPRKRDVDKDRAIVELLAQGYTPKEVAAKLGMTPGAVYTRIHRMRARGELRPPMQSAWESAETRLMALDLRLRHALDLLRLNPSEYLTRERVKEVREDLEAAVKYLDGLAEEIRFLRKLYERLSGGRR
jgi:transcriptional regulator with XRE-family HTH domain